MSIDIDRLTEAELHELNHRIVARLRYLQEVKTHSRMMQFDLGDRVTFRPPDSPILSGVIIRYNKKTLTVQTDDGSRWNVSPSLLIRASKESPAPGDSDDTAVLPARDPGGR